MPSKQCEVSDDSKSDGSDSDRSDAHGDHGDAMDDASGLRARRE